jgi:hypothetical protein
MAIATIGIDLGKNSCSLAGETPRARWCRVVSLSVV